MFQNISTDYVEERQTNKKNLKENFIKQNFSKQLIAIYLLSFMVSIVQFGQSARTDRCGRTSRRRG